jgi:gamma-glutamylcyclotransferase (GGCT)/AIG2-like uncharacterized protein YtfP
MVTDESADAGPRQPLEPEQALAVYGTLAPGESNAHVVADVAGRWIEASVRGHRFTATWQGRPSYPGFRPDPDGPLVPVLILSSPHLTEQWDRLDRFEGPGYRRVVVEVFAPDGSSRLGRACIYEALPDVAEPVR